MICKFTTAIVTLCIATSCVSKTCASEEEFPDSLIGFIKPGMHVGRERCKLDVLICLAAFGRARIG